MSKKAEGGTGFPAFYKKTSGRLARKTASYAKKLKKDDNPLIASFKDDLADLSTGGKLLRGTLIVLGYLIGGGERPEDADPLAIAYELFQTAILVHDDIIDHADLRRGKMTVHRRYSCRLAARDTKMVSAAEAPGRLAESAALCVGDLGLFTANLEIAKAYREHPALGDVISYFDETAINTIRGELLDVILPYELQDPTYSPAERKELLERSVRDIYHLKTACYSVIGPLHLGMLLAGTDSKHMRALDRAADEIGIAYQIMDDIPGIYADPDLLGKDIGSDIAEFKQTILYLYVDIYKPEYKEQLMEHYGKAATHDSLDEVRRIFEESGALDYARDAMNACFDRAIGAIKRMRSMDDEYRDILIGFADFCAKRSK